MRKQIIHLAIFLLIGAKISAHPATSTLNVQTADNDFITVVIDGFVYPGTVAGFRMENISPGVHYVRIMKSGRGRWNGRGSERTVYNSRLMTKQGEEIFVIIDYFNNVSIRRIVKHCPPVPARYDAMYSGHNSMCNSLQPQYTYFPMTAESFFVLKQTILNSNFESSRLECAKLALINNYFTSQQIADIMDLFWFESSKLEFAKSAYSHVVDSQNYYQVCNKFSFNSSVKKLNQFLAVGR